MLPVYLHPWDLDPMEAMALQSQLAARLRFIPLSKPVSLVAGIDVAIKRGVARAAVVVFQFPELKEIERVAVEQPVMFPYVPGLLSFREAPPILEALAHLRTEPDVLIFDGQGYAHPRRLGLAAHIGVLLERPTIGCAKSRLCGVYEEPAQARGARTWLYDGKEVIGAVLRTRDGVKPVFVSAGHLITLPEAIALVLACGKGYRLPEPTRQAHQLASRWGEYLV